MNKSLSRPIAPYLGQPGTHGSLIFPQACSKCVQFSDSRFCDLLEPLVEPLPLAVAHHLTKSLSNRVDAGDERINLEQCREVFLL